jgi:hypothetical protein
VILELGDACQSRKWLIPCSAGVDLSLGKNDIYNGQPDDGHGNLSLKRECGRFMVLRPLFLPGREETTEGEHNGRNSINSAVRQSNPASEPAGLTGSD